MLIIRNVVAILRKYFLFQVYCLYNYDQLGYLVFQRRIARFYVLPRQINRVMSLQIALKTVLYYTTKSALLLVIRFDLYFLLKLRI